MELLNKDFSRKVLFARQKFLVYFACTLKDHLLLNNSLESLDILKYKSALKATGRLK
jgi:hypothetical protein